MIDGNIKKGHKEKMKQKKLSFVIPCYRSMNTIGLVTDSISSTLNNHDEYIYEILLINDGSPDDTLDVIKKLAQENSCIKVINLSRNFGQHSALMAGYANVTGDYIIGLDDDGEHDASDIFKLIEELEKGYDYVCAAFPETDHAMVKKIGSRINNWMATHYVGKPADAIFSSYYIMRRFVVDEIVKCKNPFPYVGGMIVSITKNLSCVSIDHHTRTSGESGYDLKKSFSLWINGFTAFSVKPLRIATFAGLIMALFGFMYGFYVIIRKIFAPDILIGYSSTIAIILFTTGMLMITLGLVGEYVGRIYMSINKFPQYVIKEIIVQKHFDEDSRE